jgi:hypothetical protein
MTPSIVKEIQFQNSSLQCRGLFGGNGRLFKCLSAAELFNKGGK